MMKLMLRLFFSAVWLTLAACSATSTTKVVGVSARSGQELFRQSVLGGAAGCATCHSLEPGVLLIGPSLAGIGSLAEARVDGLDAEGYLRQSILDPDEYLVEGYPAGVMPQKYQDYLSQKEIDSLVTYLLSLK
jgi:mono/diheme cytochrome c family protein